MFPLLVVLAVYGTMSIVTFVAFARDKRAANQGARRTPEATLHLLELFCGWPGALLAFMIVRHKNRKLSYSLVTAFIALVHVTIWILILWHIRLRD